MEVKFKFYLKILLTKSNSTDQYTADFCTSNWVINLLCNEQNLSVSRWKLDASPLTPLNNKTSEPLDFIYLGRYHSPDGPYFTFGTQWRYLSVAYLYFTFFVNPVINNFCKRYGGALHIRVAKEIPKLICIHIRKTSPLGFWWGLRYCK